MEVGALNFTKEQIKEAEQKDIVTFGEQHGLSFTKEGKYFRCNEHDSLLITGQKYFWNSANTGGYGAISFGKDVLNMKFNEAVQTLLNDGVTVKREEAENPKTFDRNEIKQVMNTSKAYQYLLEERCIDVDVIENLIKSGDIAQDERNNVVFHWKNNSGDIVGADLRGTGDLKFNKIISGSEYGKGFKIDDLQENSPIEKLAVLESPIDTLSYYQLNRFNEDFKNTRYLSLSGVKTNAITLALKDIYEYNKQFNDRQKPFKIVLALDNDKAGNTAIKDFMERFNDNDIIKVDQPVNAKDWNEKLQSLAKDKLDLYLKDISHDRRLVNKEIRLVR